MPRNGIAGHLEKPMKMPNGDAKCPCYEHRRKARINGIARNELLD